MYVKINKRVMYRRYEEYGYLADNSLFGYRFLDDLNSNVGEKYVSASGAVMLDLLSNAPQHIDEIVRKLQSVFVGVEPALLKQDAIEFFTELAACGFIDCGDTEDQCLNQTGKVPHSMNCERPNIPDRSSCVERLSQTESIRSVHIEIANACNERCVHCYIPHDCKTKCINSELFYRIVDEARELNALNVTISGGEPLLHKDFIHFLRRCRELGFSVNVLSNLVLLSEEIVHEMQANPLLSVQASLYSMTPTIHDAITTVPGSLTKTTDSILRLISAGVPVQISCPIMKLNKDSFADVIEWGRTHNISTVTDYMIFASYDHTNANLVNRLTLSEIGDAFDGRATTEYVNSLRALADEKIAQCVESPICSICRYYLCVSADGMVFPCVGWQDHIVGDLNTTSLEKIWKTAEEVRYLRTIKRKDFPRCINCKDRGYCTVCMMANANENADGDMFHVSHFKCEVAELIHRKVDSYEKVKGQR